MAGTFEPAHIEGREVGAYIKTKDPLYSENTAVTLQNRDGVQEIPTRTNMPTFDFSDPEVAEYAAKYDVYEVHKALSAKEAKLDYTPARYPEYLPSTERGSIPGYHDAFEHVEPGTRADPAMPNLKGLPGYSEE